MGNEGFHASVFGVTGEKPLLFAPRTDFLQFASLFGLKSEEIAVVGDSIVDMEYAHNGQVGYTVAVMTGYGKREVLEKYADVIYDRVEDLINDPVILPE